MRSHSVVIVVVLTAALLACKSGPKEVKASCDMRGASGAGESSSICIDFYANPNEKVRAICSEANGYVFAPKPCDHSTALGGCKKGSLTNWYYPSSRHSSAADVKKECGSEFIASSP
jgi:hypothetical protein